MSTTSEFSADKQDRQPAFVYVSIIRTASRSLRTTLFPGEATSTEAPCYWNLSALEIREDFLRRGWDWDACFKFSVVRNPWDRLVSAYHFWPPGVAAPAVSEGLEPPSEFNAWIRWLVDRPEDENKLLLRQGRLLVDDSGTLLVDKVYRYEDMASRWQEISRRTGIKKALPHAHKTVHRHYSRYYDPASRELIGQACKDDVERFGFEFQNLARHEKLVDEGRFQIGKTRLGLRTHLRDSLRSRAPRVLEQLRKLRRP